MNCLWGLGLRCSVSRTRQINSILTFSHFGNSERFGHIRPLCEDMKKIHHVFSSFSEVWFFPEPFMNEFEDV